MAIIHQKVSGKPPASDSTKVGGPDYNKPHVLSDGTDGPVASNGAFTLSSGWGTGRSVSAARGPDDGHEFTVNSGTSPSANPTISYTFLEGAHTVKPIMKAQLIDGTGQKMDFNLTPSLSGYVITMLGTPQPSETYIFSVSFQRFR